MRRLGRRVGMVAVGLSFLAFYGGAAYLLSVLLVEVVRDPPALLVMVAVVVGTTLVVGYLNYRFGMLSAVSGLGAAELSRTRAPGVYVRVDRLCDRMDRDPPRLLVADPPLPNAFALGGANGGVLVFDRMLFWLLDADEFEAIVAHELAHLESRDSLVQTLAYTAVQTVAGTLLLGVLPVTLAVTGVARGLAWLRGRPEEWAASSLLWIRNGIEHGAAAVLVGLTLLLRAHSRGHEYAADDRAAAVTGDPLALARSTEDPTRRPTTLGTVRPVLRRYRRRVPPRPTLRDSPADGRPDPPTPRSGGRPGALRPRSLMAERCPRCRGREYTN